MSAPRVPQSTPRGTRSGLRSNEDPLTSSEDFTPTLPPAEEMPELTPSSEEEVPPAHDSDSPEPPAPVDVQAQVMRLFEALAANQGLLQGLITQQTTSRYPSRSPDHTPAGAREPNVQDPDTFNGNRDALNGFLTQVQLVFELQPQRFPTDHIKINYVIAKFRGTPLNAVRPYLAMTDFDKPDWLRTYSNFVEYLRRNYGDPDEIGTAERKLNSLAQKGSAASFFAEFQQYSAILGWDDAPLISMAIRGLKDELKDQLVLIGDRPRTMSSLIDIVVRLDNRIWERKQEKRVEPRSTHDNLRGSTTRTTVSNTTTYPNRTEDRRNPSRPAYSVPQNQRSSPPPQNVTGQGTPRRLSEEEKQRRRDQGLCLFCGQAGHVAASCPAAGRSGAGQGNSAPARASSQAPVSSTTRFEQSKVGAPPK